MYRFGAFTFDCVSYRVTHGAHVVNLTPKLLDLLLYLLERPAMLVTKDELLDALWPGANVTQNALAQAISELRQALGDDAASPQFIRTVARRGYRFIAPVTIPADAAAASTTIHAVNASAAGPAASASAAVDKPRAESQTATGSAPIAVMDFSVTAGDRVDTWLGAGITETVTSDLGRLRHFRVVDRRRVGEAVRATDGSLEQVAAALGARLIVVGSVQRNQQKVRITSRIVDVVSGEAVADAKVDGAMDEIFDLQDQVVVQLVRELALPAGGTHARDTASLHAFQAFTEGWLALESLEVAPMQAAVGHFERAVAADPGYARAYAGLASAELACYESTRADNVPDDALLQRAVAHAQDASRLDETLAEAHATVALVLVSAGRTIEAAAAGRRAVALEPSAWRHWFRLGHATWGSERLRAAAQTLALYPEFAFSYFQAAMVHVARRDLTEAETMLRQGAAVQDRQLARGGRYPALGLHWLLGLVRLAADDVDESLAEFARESALAAPYRLYGREFQMHAATGRAAALVRTGRPEQAIVSYREALKLYPDNAPASLGLAAAYQILGRTDDAEAWRQRTDTVLKILQDRHPLYTAMVRADMLVGAREQAAAAALLTDALRSAPPGFACWTLPVEPAFRQVLPAEAFAPVLRALTERAR